MYKKGRTSAQNDELTIVVDGGGKGRYGGEVSVVLENKVSQWRELYSCCLVFRDAELHAGSPFWAV